MLLLLISLILFASTPVANGALAFPATSGTRLLAKPTDTGEDDISSSSSSPPERQRRGRRKRCVDFPSSAYRQRSSRSRTPSSSNSGSANGDDDSKSLPYVQLSGLKRSKASIFEPEIASFEVAAERTRLLTYRSYARGDAFLPENISVAPTLEDLSSSPADVNRFDRYWAGVPFRIAVLAVAYFAFPYLTMFLDDFVTMAPNELDEINSKFGPGISILYGTFISLTLNILYNRQQAIQTSASTESALLALVQRKVLAIFRDDREMAIEGSQCVADQIRTLVSGGRGQELMGIMYSDPYARILELIEEREYRLMQENSNSLGAQSVVLGSARDILKDLVKTRAVRLSNEALALPPTHFFILTVVTILILFSYTVSVLPTVNLEGRPSNESSLLFAALCAVYVLFFNFANDVNNAFQGVYQIRRSSTASHLLQTKFLIASHPLVRGEVDFAPHSEDSSTGDVRVRSPGLGDMMIGKTGLYPPPDAEEDLLLKE